MAICMVARLDDDRGERDDVSTHCLVGPQLKAAMIPITKGVVVIVDRADLNPLSAHRWQLTSNGYAARGGGPYRPTVLMHRQILGVPDGLYADHINGDRLDNRRANLRICTAAENARNRRKTGRRCTSEFKGVRELSAGRWAASIKADGEVNHLGVFQSALDAALAYDRAAISLFGDFAVLNVPDAHKAYAGRTGGRRGPNSQD